MNSTEFIDLSGVCSATLPNYPNKLCATTGQFLDDAAIICGGYHITDHFISDCFFLRYGANSFEIMTPMIEERAFAKSIVTQGRIWVTGGVNEYGRISSTEYIPKSSTPEPSLPEPVEKHAVISINDTTSMLIGGSTNSNFYSPKTYYFNHKSNTWKNGPNLISGRYFHAAGLIMDHVTHKQHIAVVGGSDGGNRNSVELLLNGETQWTKGI